MSPAGSPPPRRDYAAAFLLIAAVLVWHARNGGVWWVLLWPAAAGGGVGLAYLTNRPGLLGKRADGTRNPCAAALFLPYTAYALAVWHLWRVVDRVPARNDAGEFLTLSRRPLPGELPGPDDEPLAAVLDLTAEFAARPAVRALPGYRCLPVLDAAAPDPAALHAAVLALAPPERGRILIHCANGRGRTGLAAAAWLLVHGFAATPGEAVARLKAARPSVRLHRGQRAVLGRIADRSAL